MAQPLATMNGLALQVQEGWGVIRTPATSSCSAASWHDGVGMSLYAKRLDQGVRRAVLLREGPLIRLTIWPTPTGGAVQVSAAQLGYLLDGIPEFDTSRAISFSLNKADVSDFAR